MYIFLICFCRNLSCAWRFDRSRNTSEIIYTLHLEGMKNTPDTISLYGGRHTLSRLLSHGPVSYHGLFKCGVMGEGCDV